MKWLKVFGVLFGAVLITALGIDAADTLSGSRSTLLGQALSSVNERSCKDGMVRIDTTESMLCMDIYEATASDACPHHSPMNEVQTQENLNTENCIAESKQRVIPWRFVSEVQAQQLCTRSGKRLPTNKEWFMAASSMVSLTSCVLHAESDAPAQSGSSNCIAPSGVYDLVGNVWEWVDEEVHNGLYNNRVVPKSGYVSSVDTAGVILETSPVSSLDFGDDYAVTAVEGTSGMIRGGFYGSKDDGGIFAQNLSVPLDLKSAGVGFRCVSVL